MHLLIFDPHEHGHYLTYVRYLLTAARAADKVTLVLRQGIEDSVPFREQLRDRIGDCNLDCPIGLESYRDGKALLTDFDAALRRHRPDHVWVPSADLLVRETGVASWLRGWHFPRGVEGEAGLVEIRFHRPPKRWRGHLRNAFDRATVQHGPWKGRHTIDPTVHEHLSSPGRTVQWLRTLPDPLDDEVGAPGKTEARRLLGIPQDGWYVGSIGAHAVPRKGSELLLNAFLAAGLDSSHRLLLVGPLGEHLRMRLRDAPDLLESGRVVTIDQYVEERSLPVVLAAMDLVCTPYVGHMGSSGIALRAVQAGRPVLAPAQGWFGDMLPRFGLGYTGPILDVQALATAIAQAVEPSRTYTVSTAARRLLVYSRASNFAALWAVRLRERLGLAPDTTVRTWDWVVEALPRLSAP